MCQACYCNYFQPKYLSCARHDAQAFIIQLLSTLAHLHKEVFCHFPIPTQYILVVHIAPFIYHVKVKQNTTIKYAANEEVIMHLSVSYDSDISFF